MNRLFLFAAIVATAFPLHAQIQLQYNSPAQIFNDASEKLNEGDTASALNLLKQINENDSVFEEASALYANIILEKGLYDRAEELCDSFLAMPGIKPYSFIVIKGVSYVRKEDNAAAVETFKKGLETYPMSYLLYYNLGVAYENSGDIVHATDSYQRSILLNAFYSPPHTRLAGICYNERLISQAVLCWDTYLLLDVDHKDAVRALVRMNDAVSKNYDGTPLNVDVSADDDLFRQSDLIVTNYAALSKNYKIKNKISLPLVKQNHAIMEVLPSGGGNGFWSRKYVTFYKELLARDYFDAFIYTILRESESEDHQNIVAKNSRSRDEFISWAGPEVARIFGSGNGDLFGNPGKDFFYKDNGVISAVGLKDAEGNLDGKFTFYYPEGNILSTGFFKKGERDREWTFFREDGSIETRANYSGGVLTGEYTTYYENGKIKEHGYYSEGKLNGAIREYTIFGALQSVSAYKNGTLEGLSTINHYLGEGFKKYDVNYVNGQPAGKVTELYEDGNIKDVMNFEDGNLSGEELEYFQNGALSYVYHYSGGELDGEYLSFYADSTKHQQGSYLKDKEAGLWSNYYRWGILSSEDTYGNDGQLNGMHREYSTSGKLLEELNYENGILTDYKVYSPSGNLMFEGSIEKNSIEYKGVNAYGVMAASGKFVNGKKDSAWEFYDSYGLHSSDEIYKNGLLEGEATTYYTDGLPESTTIYSEGKKEGLYESYYITGAPEIRGWYVNDKAEGEWLLFNPDGSVREKRYYLNDVQDGYQYRYSAEGYLYEKNYMKDGMYLSSIYYDSLGVPVDTADISINGVMKFYFPDGKIRKEITYLNGYAHGNYISYHPNGLKSSEGSYFSGSLDGLWQSWDEKGNISSEALYRKGERHGATKLYHPDGKISEIMYYANDDLHGPDISLSAGGDTTFKAMYVYGDVDGPAYSYDDEGQLQIIRYYDHGVITGYSYNGTDGKPVEMIPLIRGSGQVTSFYSNGMKSREYFYKGGQYDGIFKKYYSNGNLWESSAYIYGIQNGESVIYYPDGSVKEKCTYINDEINGKYVSYHPNGKVSEELNYINGYLTGEAKYFDENGKIIKILNYYNGEVTNAEYL